MTDGSPARDGVSRPVPDGEPTNEQIRDRIDALMRRPDEASDGSSAGPDADGHAELDQLWLMLRARDAGPETEERGAPGSA